MADVLSKTKRSQVMGTIRSTGNRGTELRLVSILRDYGITGWRRHLPLPGKPDFVFPKARLVVFVDGGFWHGCRWHCRMPEDNRAYWRRKIQGNAKRDGAVTRLLRGQGWRVLRIWEHSLRAPISVASRVQ